MKAEKGDKINIKKIGATLKHGRFVAYNIYLACFGIVFSFAALIGSYFLFYKERQSSPILTYTIIVSFWALFFFGSLFTIIKTLKIKKEVLFWLEDAIELDAYAEQLIRVGYEGLKIHFVYNNEKINRMSRCKHWRSPEGYDLWWQYYINKSIKIYYSTKYDEVMLFIAKAP